MIQFSIWSVLFFLVASQGLLLSLQIRNEVATSKVQRIFRAAYILVLSVMLFFWVGFWNNYHEKNTIFLLAFYSIPFLLGPFYYLYVKLAVGNKPGNYLFHFIPFFASLLYSFIALFTWSDSNTQPINGAVLTSLIYSLHTCSFLIYGLLTYVTFKNEKNSLVINTSRLKFLNLKSEVVLFGIFSLVALVNFVLNRIAGADVFLDPILGLLCVMIIYVSSYLMPFSVYRNHKKLHKTEKYVRSSLSHDSKHILFQKLTNYMNREKPFLMSDFRIRDLSTATEIPSHHISELLNQYYGKGFSEFINGYRIEEAQRILMSDEPVNKISLLGYEVGFNSNATFHTWFKSITGNSPRQFQNRYKKSLK